MMPLAVRESSIRKVVETSSERYELSCSSMALCTGANALKTLLLLDISFSGEVNADFFYSQQVANINKTWTPALRRKEDDEGHESSIFFVDLAQGE